MTEIGMRPTRPEADWKEHGDCGRNGCAGVMWACPLTTLVMCDTCGREMFRATYVRGFGGRTYEHRPKKAGPRKAPATGVDRDQQRGKIYAAERDCIAWTGQRAACYDTLPEVVGFLHHVMTQRWFRARWSLTIRDVVVEDGRGQRRATCTGRLIELPRWSRYDAVILHELGHALAPDRHGPIFARTMLTLFRYALGKDAADSLRAEYRKQRVKVGPAIRTRAVPTPPARTSVYVQLPTDLAARIAARVPEQQRAAFYEAALRDGLRRFRLAKTTTEKQLAKAARAKR